MKPVRIAGTTLLLLLAATGCGNDRPSEATEASAAPSSTPASSAAPPSESASEAGQLAITGDFGADLKKYTGIVPDDLADYEDFMTESLCETDLNATMGPEFPFQVKRGGANDPASGYHPDMVRLVIAYNCPERADAAERYLKEI